MQLLLVAGVWQGGLLLLQVVLLLLLVLLRSNGGCIPANSPAIHALRSATTCSLDSRTVGAGVVSWLAAAWVRTNAGGDACAQGLQLGSQLVLKWTHPY